MNTAATNQSSTDHRRPSGLWARPFLWWDGVLCALARRLGGKRPKEMERFLKFATVGVIGAVIDFGVLNLMQVTVLKPVDPDLSLKVALATGVAFVSAVSSNFVWNRYWTYPDSRTRSVQKQLVQFFVVSLAGLVFRLIWVRLLFTPFGTIGVDALVGLGVIDSMAQEATKRLGTNIAQFWAVWIVMIWNFFANRYWTYNDVE